MNTVEKIEDRRIKMRWEIFNHIPRSEEVVWNKSQIPLK